MNTTELAQSLPAVLASVPDPRGLRGRRHPLPAILTLAVCAMLSGARSLYAIHPPGWTSPPAGSRRRRRRSAGQSRSGSPCVDGDDAPAQLQQRQQLGDGGDFVGMGLGAGLAQHQVILGGPNGAASKMPPRCRPWVSPGPGRQRWAACIPYSVGWTRPPSRPLWPGGAGRDCRKGAPLRWTAKPCGGFTAKSCPGCAWWPDMLTNPAWW